MNIFEKLPPATSTPKVKADSVERVSPPNKKVRGRKSSDENKRNKDFCLDLVHAESEAKIVDILQAHGYWNNSECWKPYGGNRHNWSTVGNQQENAAAALVEKLINSIDHVVIGKCKEAGIDPNGSDAPKSMAEAMEKFFSVKAGNLSNITQTERRELSNYISLVATGPEGKVAREIPNYIIADAGEGQTPNNMPRTLLSLNSGNKNEILFVQGKFNMGSTGVCRFGKGEHKFQLILTKRNPTLLSADEKASDDSHDKWGVTIIRKNPPEGRKKSSVMEYLVCPNNQEIISFASDSLPILAGDFPAAYEKPMYHGVFTKLYEYSIKGKASRIETGLRYLLNSIMVSPPLPIALHERRATYRKSFITDARLNGLKHRLDEAKKDIEHRSELTFKPIGGSRIKGEVYVMKVHHEGKDANLRIDDYVPDNKGVLFMVNGQSHGSLTRTVFASTRSRIHFPYLKEYMFVFIDCTNLSAAQIEDIFMNSRDRLNKDSKILDEIKEQLYEGLRNHSDLKRLNAERQAQTLAPGKQADMSSVFEKLYKNYQYLAQIQRGESIKVPKPLPKSFPMIDTKEFPTKFELVGKFTKDKPKNIPDNKKDIEIIYETDADINYFARDKDAGNFRLIIDGEEYYDYALPNIDSTGKARLRIAKPKKWNKGDVLQIRTEVTDISRINPFIEEFFVKIVESSETKPSRPSPPKTGNMPKLNEVERKYWKDHGFNKDSALKISESADDCVFYINVDNLYLEIEMKKQKNSSQAESLKNQFVFGMLLIGIALLQKSKDSTEKDDEEDIYKEISKTAKSLAPMVLPLMNHGNLLDVVAADDE